MRLPLVLSCLVLLAACTPPFPPGLPTLAGTWADDAARFEVCDQEGVISTALTLTQTGADLQGTFTLPVNSFPFRGFRHLGRSYSG